MEQLEHIRNIERTDRISSLRERTLSSPRYLSLEQARIITRIYKKHENVSVSLKRAHALAASLTEMPISIDPFELLVGNRTPTFAGKTLYHLARMLLRERKVLLALDRDRGNRTPPIDWLGG